MTNNRIHYFSCGNALSVMALTQMFCYRGMFRESFPGKSFFRHVGILTSPSSAPFLFSSLQFPTDHLQSTLLSSFLSLSRAGRSTTLPSSATFLSCHRVHDFFRAREIRSANEVHHGLDVASSLLGVEGAVNSAQHCPGQEIKATHVL